MNGTMEIRIGGIGTALPPLSLTQAEVKEFLAVRYGHSLTAKGRAILDKVMEHPSVRRRHFGFDDTATLLSEDHDARMARFERWSVELSVRAAQKAMASAGISPAELTGVVVNTCTGYLCPGIATYLIERLGLPRTIRAYDLAGSGCGGAVPNIEVASGILRAVGSGAVLSVSVEVCSAAFQMGDDPSLIVSNALFGDGAAAAVLWTRRSGSLVGGSASAYVPEEREAVRFVYRNGGLNNRISPRLPSLVAKASEELVARLLRQEGLSAGDIRHWAVHPGGEKIIGAVRDALKVDESAMAASRAVLADVGNLSSATIWFILETVLPRAAPGERCLCLVYGAGMSVHACLLTA
ncbi:MAG: type III polyketide synthase [Nitrospinae bacterium]|nr:type III polyketide synthase [Nitrospinota bacterium]